MVECRGQSGSSGLIASEPYAVSDAFAKLNRELLTSIPLRY
jgi:hypothetical protein